MDLIIASFMEYLPPRSTEWLKQILNGEKWHSPKYEFCQIRQVELHVNFFNKPVGLLIMYLEITKVNSKVEDSFFFKIFDFSAIFWKWYTWNIFHSVLKNDFRCKHLLAFYFCALIRDYRFDLEPSMGNYSQNFTAMLSFLFIFSF